jgi:3-methyladenine DNA glycosylase AlkD
MKSECIIDNSKSLYNPKAVAGMARFGIVSDNNYCVSIAELIKMAKEIGTDHNLAIHLWQSCIHEARILACIIDDPNLITEAQMEKWFNDFNSWDICDQCCSNRFYKTRYAPHNIIEWCFSEKEFVKRTGFVLMAVMAVHCKETDDLFFERFLPIIRAGAFDNINFVKKAVNWALRQIGKRSTYLNSKAIETARQIQQLETKSSRWIASNAIQELMSQVV